RKFILRLSPDFSHGLVWNLAWSCASANPIDSGPHGSNPLEIGGDIGIIRVQPHGEWQRKFILRLSPDFSHGLVWNLAWSCASANPIDSGPHGANPLEIGGDIGIIRVQPHGEWQRKFILRLSPDFSHGLV